ncbi:hypothetical protein ACKKBG_A38625 [Auxenochlorella protothecoides x Auxenochlorella symbiontica]
MCADHPWTMMDATAQAIGANTRSDVYPCLRQVSGVADQPRPHADPCLRHPLPSRPPRKGCRHCIACTGYGPAAQPSPQLPDEWQTTGAWSATQYYRAWAAHPAAPLRRVQPWNKDILWAAATLSDADAAGSSAPQSAPWRRMEDGPANPSMLRSLRGLRPLAVLIPDAYTQIPKAGRGVEMLPSQNAPCSKGQVALQAAHIPYDWPCTSSQGGASTKCNLPQRQAGPWVKTPQAPLVAHVWQTFAAPGRHTPFFGNTTDYSRSQGYV